MSDGPRGSWGCPKCGFIETRNVLHAQDGSVGPDTTVGDFACPNDGELLVALTWEDMYRNISKTCQGQIVRAVEAEEENKRLANIIKQCVQYVNPDGFAAYANDIPRQKLIREMLVVFHKHGIELFSADSFTNVGGTSKSTPIEPTCG